MKKRCSLYSFILAAIILTASSAAFAEEISFRATIDRNVLSLGQSGQLGLEFQGSSSIPAPDDLEIDGVQIRYVGPSTRMSIVNGRMSSSVTHMYRIIPLRTGKIHINPITFTYKGNTYTSNELDIEVLDSASGPAPDRQQDQRQVNLGDRVFIKMLPAKAIVYVNEIIPLTVKLYARGVAVRDIQYPTYHREGFSGGEFDRPGQYKENVGGHEYDVVEFQTEVFATKTGELVLGPASIKAALVTKRSRRSSSRDNFFGRDPFDGFFGNYEAHSIELKSEKISMNVLPLPEQGRPDHFRGAIGVFDFSVDVSSSTVKAGDPLSVTMTVSGQGNFDTVTSPSLKEYDGFKVYEPKTRQEENKKVFEQVFIPTTDAVRKIPLFHFTFFSTDKGEYQTIAGRDIPLTVLKPDRKEEITILGASNEGRRPLVKETFGRDIIYIKESPGTFRVRGHYLYNNNIFLLLHLVPFIACIAAFIIHKRKMRLSTDIVYARRLRAPKKAKKTVREAESFLKNSKPEEFYDAVFRTVREYVGDRFHVPSGGMTAESAIGLLGNKGIERDILLRLKNVFAECDMARYAPAGRDSGMMEHTLQELKEIIDFLERHKG